jgi:hypothetical protein
VVSQWNASVGSFAAIYDCSAVTLESKADWSLLFEKGGGWHGIRLCGNFVLSPGLTLAILGCYGSAWPF